MRRGNSHEYVIKWGFIYFMTFIIISEPFKKAF